MSTAKAQRVERARKAAWKAARDAQDAPQPGAWTVARVGDRVLILQDGWRLNPQLAEWLASPECLDAFRAWQQEQSWMGRTP